MKKYICFLLMTALLLSMTACGGVAAPETPTGQAVTEAPSAPTEIEVLDPITPEDIVGCYRAQDENAHYIQIRRWNDFFTVEHLVNDEDGEWIWAQEFWPNEDGWPAEEGKPVEGLIQQFCIVTEGMIFDDRPMNCSVELTEDGIAITIDGAEKQYVRDDTYPGNHTSNQELITQLYESIGDLNWNALAGSWYYWDGETVEFLELAEDGRCLYMRKHVHEAPYILEGAWGISGESLVLWTELLGGYSNPMQTNLTWSYNAELDEMVFYDGDGSLLRESQVIYMNSYSPEMDIYFTQHDALGYVEYMIDEWMYSEADGDYDASYFYQIPRIIGDTEIISEINQEIYYDFGVLAEQGMSDCAAGEELKWSSIYHEEFWTGTVITLMVHGSGDYEEFHKAYYYDTRTDTRLYPEDMLALWGLDQESYLESLREQAKKEFEYCHFEYSEEELQQKGADACLAWTLSDDNLNVQRPVYRTDDGTTVTYVQMETVYDCHWVPIYMWAEQENVG